MPVIVVTSAEQGAGKTGVAAAIARQAAYSGRSTRLLRIASGAPGSQAENDAAWFGSLFFVPGSPAVPVSGDALSAAGDTLYVVETDAGTLPAGVDGPTVVVSRDERTSVAGVNPAAIVRTRARSASISGGDGQPLVVQVPEDRTLNGFSVAEARDLLHAEVLVEGEPGAETCDYLVVAPIGSDAGEPYFRRFHTKAVVARFDKTDMHLAAMQTRPACLILSGGRQPSGYLFDAAEAQGVTVLLSRTDTENTVIALERVYDRTRFTGERKLERMAELLGATPLFATLGL